jgi:hypothetical protein
MVRATRLVPKPFVPADHTQLTMQPCLAGEQAQNFSMNATDGTIRLTDAMAKCIDLYECDASQGMMDIYTCHVPGDRSCPGATSPPTNQLFALNSNGTITYKSSPVYCLGSTPIGSAGVSDVKLQKCTGAANQLWQLTGAGTSHLIQQKGGDHCISV